MNDEVSPETIEEEFINEIFGLIVVGWRKGVDGEGSGKVHSTLNPLFTNADQRIRDYVNGCLKSMAKAFVEGFSKRVPVETIAQAMKSAAINFDVPEELRKQLTPENEGIQMLMKLLPIEFLYYGESRIAYTETEWGEKLIQSQWFDRKETPPVWKYHAKLNVDELTYIGAVLLKLAQEIPEVAEYFKDNMFDNFHFLKKTILKVHKDVTDDGWECLVTWLLYAIDEEKYPAVTRTWEKRRNQ